MKRAILRSGLVAFVVAGLAACNPTFDEGAALTVAVDEDSVEVSWPEAQPREDGPPIVSYQLYVGDELIRESDAEGRFCDLFGLAGGQEHEVWVRAVDGEGAGSNLLTATVSGPAGSEGGEIFCGIFLPPIDM